jgi:uncharacterized protein (TIGR04255 family)
MVLLKKVRPAMPFPEIERVIYDVNPLEEVICQLTFPSILRIEAERPVTFQERIRASYPFYKVNPVIQLGLSQSPNLPEVARQDMPRMVQHLNHEFGSKDGNWTVVLNTESISLTCKRYKRWEEFRKILSDLATTLQDIYSPGFYVRIGLRYKNMIRRSQLGLSGVEWSDLLSSGIAGAYSSPGIKGDIQHSFLQMIIRLPRDGSRVLISSGTAIDAATGEECYAIDADFSTDQQTESRNAFDQLDFLNSQSDRFFHWCVGHRLRNALLRQSSAT